MQDELHIKFATLEKKVTDLLLKYDKLKTDNIELINQIKKIKEENTILKNKSINLKSNTHEQQYAIDFDSKHTDNKRVKKEIESAVKKIEECIDWLQKY
jgi:hypothetical protein